MPHFHDPGAPYQRYETTQNTETSDEPITLAPAPEDAPRGLAWLKANYKWPLILFAITFSVLSLTSFKRVTKPSQDLHFAYLAKTYNEMILATFDDEAKARRADKVAFEMHAKPPHRNDWASYWELTTKDGEQFKGIWLDQRKGQFKTLDKRVVKLERRFIDHSKTNRRYFVSFPPGPGLIFMPFVAMFDVQRVNDVLITIFFASLNVVLLFLLLERLARGGRSGRSRKDNLWLLLLFAFGSCHYWLSTMGQVWFTAQIMGVTWTLLYIHAAIDARHPLLAGLACAMAFSTRTPLLFTSVFFFIFVLFPNGQRLQKEQFSWALKKLIWFCIPCLVVGIGLLTMNKIRFDSWTEFGHTYLAAGQLQRIKTYGLFNSHFLSKNLTSLFTLLPKIQTSAPYLVISKHGMSILLTTPAFLYLLRPQPREHREDVFWHRLLWATVAACALPGLFYQNTGYEQFGFRFSMDYTPYLIMLLAVGRHPITKWFKLSILWGVAVNTFGAITFKRFYQFYSGRFFV